MARKVTALLVTAVAVVAGGRLAGAQPLDDHGYWWRGQSGVGPYLPSPPLVPAGGMWVANDATGPLAVSAVRATLPSPRGAAQLVLHSEDTVGSPSLTACPATREWASSQAGAWRDAPAADCTAGHALGVLDVDGSTWRFAVDALEDEGVVDVVVFPSPSTSSPFSVTFLPPGDDALAVAPAPQDQSTPSGDSPTTVTTFSSPASAPAADVPPPMTFVPAPPGAAFALVPTTSAVSPPTTTGTARLAAERGPESGEAPPLHAGVREPLALLVAVAFVVAWTIHSRSVAHAMPAHALAVSTHLDGGALHGVQQVLHSSAGTRRGRRG